MFLLIAQQLLGQPQKETITIEQLLTTLVSEIDADSISSFKNVEITPQERDNFSAFEFLSENFPELEKIDGRIVIPQTLLFEECTFPSFFSLDSLHFRKELIFELSSQPSDGYVILENIYTEDIFYFINNDFGTVVLNNSLFKNEVIFQSNQLQELLAYNNEFRGLVYYELNKTESAVVFDNNLFNPSNEINLIFNDWFKDSVRVTSSLQINNLTLPELNLLGNKFNSTSKYNLINLVGSINHLKIDQNEINGILQLDCRISGTLEITSNQIQFMDLSRTGFSETHNLLSFPDNPPSMVKVISVAAPYLSGDESIFWDFDQVQLDSTQENSIGELQMAYDVYTIDHINQDSFDSYYLELIRAKYYLQNAFHANGDVYNTNYWYVNMKEHEALWLKRELMHTGSFSILTRWLLNRLMKAYTEHGTSPGKAMWVSICIIMGFAFVYLFFPSEWEKESKSSMILNYKKFVKKNGQGYRKPFLNLISGITISYINALTLSLNSFVTLGFGRIPTIGIARYICVLEGFVGWFLLSLFTVALINQVLF